MRKNKSKQTLHTKCHLSASRADQTSHLQRIHMVHPYLGVVSRYVQLPMRFSALYSLQTKQTL